MVEEIEPADLCRRLESGELWQIIDVREPWEIEIANVEGTIDIPMACLPERLYELDSQRQTAVLCHSGARSLRVALYLETCGFGHVANIRGGIDLWSKTVSPAIARY